MRHIGILGGTFNPIHLGHLILGESAREQLELARVLFIPTALPPHKDEPDLLQAEARLALVQAATAANPAFAVSDLEIRRGGRSYTIDTLRALRDQPGPETAWTVLVGSDAAATLTQWKSFDDIQQLARIVVAERPGHPLNHLPAEVSRIKIPTLDISSTDIRRRIAAGQSVRYLVGDPVATLLERHGYYRSGQ